MSSRCCVPKRFRNHVTVQCLQPEPEQFPDRFAAWVSNGGKPVPPPGYKCYTNKNKAIRHTHSVAEHENSDNPPNAVVVPNRLLPTVQDDHPASLPTIVTGPSKQYLQYTRRAHNMLHVSLDDYETEDEDDSRLSDDADDFQEALTNVQKIIRDIILPSRASALTVNNCPPNMFIYKYVHNQNEREGNIVQVTNTEDKEDNTDEKETEIKNESYLSEDFRDRDTNGDLFEIVNDDFEEAKPKAIKQGRESGKRKREQFKMKALNQTSKEVRRRELRQKLEEMQKKMDEYFHVTVFKSMEEKIAELQRHKYDASYINAPHKCGICYKGFGTDESYNQHMMKHTAQGGAYECVVCHTRWATSMSLSQHEYVRHSRGYSCKVCRFETPDRNVATLHWRFHDAAKQALTNGTDLPAGGFSCDECGVKFATHEALRRHMTSLRHRRYKTKEERAAEMRERQKYDEPVPCEKCGALVATPSEYHHHFQRAHWGQKRAWFPETTHPLLCEICGKKLKGHELKGHMAEHDESVTFQCGTCGKRFSRKMYLYMHIQRHVSRYACSVCGKLFTSLSNRGRHVRYVHSASQDFECKMCGTRFKTEGSRKLHIYHVHLRNPYPKRNRQKKTEHET